MQRDYRWIEPKEVAALVRKRLKARFPGQKFSVRSSKFAGGSSVDVSYTGGPAQCLVDEEISDYQFARFDSMTDYGYSCELWLNASTGETRMAQVEETTSTRHQDNPCPGPGWERVRGGQMFVHAQRTDAIDEPCAVCGEVPEPHTWRYRAENHQSRGECKNATCRRVCEELSGPVEAQWHLQVAVGRVDWTPHEEGHGWFACRQANDVTAARKNYQLATQEELSHA